ncbi:MAG: SDR family NAD(P)-dependent oxidoreductase [Ilumatobacteraceae bacterium]
MTERRVAVINDGSFYVGPPLALRLAELGHDLVIGNPAEGLLDQLESLGCRAVGVTVSRDASHPEVAPALAAASLQHFGRIDSASIASGLIVTGSIVKSSRQDLDKVYTGCVVAPYEFLKAMLPVMVEQRSGQVLLITSASGSRPTPGAPLYSSMRAAATMLAKNAAGEMAKHNVQVNAVGTNFMDFPEFRRASGADDPEVRRKIESQVPLGRLGTLDEFAHFCLPYLDGRSTFATGQYVSFSGGWS